MSEQFPDINPNLTDEKLARAVDDTKKEADNLIRLSTGVVLKAKQANPNILIRVMTKLPRPNPPLVYMEAMGREIENAADPDYLSRVQAWQMDYSNGMLNVLIGCGTEIVSIPDSMQKPNDEKWIADYRALGLPVILDSPAWRYITWVMFVAAPTEKDTNLIGEKVRSLSGVKEAAVQNAQQFPKSDQAGR